MKIRILARGTGWHVQDMLRAALIERHDIDILDMRTLSTAFLSHANRGESIVVRTIPAGSLEQIIFRMDLLHALATKDVRIFNPPRALETCIDKYLTNVRLEEQSILCPPTVVCQTFDDAMLAFEALERDVVIKPIFGSEGRGMVRVTDEEIAWRTFQAIATTNQILYVQKYIQHLGWDMRVLTLGGKVLGAMRRHHKTDWRTNIARGGIAMQSTIGREVEEIALKAAHATSAIFAGVDLLQSLDGRWYVLEVNAVPGWRALSSVCNTDVARHFVQFITS